MVRITLTTIARSHAEGAGLLGRLEALQLGEWTMVGDYVTLPDAGPKGTFIVQARHISVDGTGRPSLTLVLDYPPRPAAR